MKESLRYALSILLQLLASQIAILNSECSFSIRKHEQVEDPE